MNAYECKELAKLLYPDTAETVDFYEKKYPPRNLPAGAMVTRFAPSPTGFVHMGSLLPSFVSERLGRQSDGVFYLRIEDTDKKREISDGVSGIIRDLFNFGIIPDEGTTEDGLHEIGAYGPYIQSKRIRIYHCYARHLVEKGFAYPCFCSKQQNKEIRMKQKTLKADPGYYGEWAVHRDMNLAQIKSLLENGVPFVLRLRSPENTGKRLAYNDLIKGHIELPENFQDTILLKSDGLPTYHFAHVVDDHLMKTTHVIRGDEWLSSVPVHIQLFGCFGWNTPMYAHISPVMKEDGNSRRKLSKRKDPEAAVSYYHEMGYPNVVVQEYLLNLINSNFEDWRRANPLQNNREFAVDLGRMSVSGALFDLVKLNDISCNTIALMEAGDVYHQVIDWADAYDTEFVDLLRADPSYAVKIFSVERGGPKPRKDISMWSQVKDYVRFFYDSIFNIDNEISNLKSLDSCKVTAEDRTPLLTGYLPLYDINDNADTWFEKIRDLADSMGYTKDMKAYRKDPSKWKGSVGDVCTLIRIALTGRTKTPDLWGIMQVIGGERVRERLNAWISKY